MKNDFKNSKSNSILLLIYSNPFHFQPTINAANILYEHGMDVHLIGIENKDNWNQDIHEGVKVKYMSGKQTGIRGILKYFKSIFFLWKYIRNNEIKTVIGYDAKTVFPLFLNSRVLKLNWFFHQHDFWEKPKGIWEKLLWKSERRFARYANHVSFPQFERAVYFKQVARLKEMPIIIFNGPRRKWLKGIIEPSKIVVEYKKKFDYLLIYQGSWSSYFGLEKLFDALAICKTNTALIMLGEEREIGLRKQYIEYLHKLGIADRVYLAEKYIHYEELPSFTLYADAAIGKLTGENDDAPFNDRFLIGAANKITEYIACGLPVILQESVSNLSFLEKYQIGITTDTNNKILFAKTIDELLTNNKLRENFKNENKRIFQNELNFDYQFQKILDLIN